MSKVTINNSTLLMTVIQLIIILTCCVHSNAQEETAKLSGRVVDANGKPVAEIEVAIKPILVNRGWEQGPREPFSSWAIAVTDKDGGFSLSNIKPGRSRLVIIPELGSPYEIISLEIGEITIYSTAFRPSHPTWYGKPTFGIDPGESLENVVVNVQKPRMRISGQVLLADKTPLANTEIDLTVYRRNRDTFLFFFSSGGGGGSSGRIVRTDAHGYFVSYSPEKSAEYMVMVKHEGVSAKSRWFRLKKGQRKDNLVLRFKSINTHSLIRYKVWTVNPENHHAYKRIECSSWENAKAKAKDENAYLVSINNEKEQKWIESRFREKKFFWIGLQVPNKEEVWQWNSSEPVAYTNWGSSGIPENTINREVTVALLFSNKKWIAIESNSPLIPFVQHAILEKEDY